MHYLLPTVLPARKARWALREYPAPPVLQAPGVQVVALPVPLALPDQQAVTAFPVSRGLPVPSALRALQALTATMVLQALPDQPVWAAELRVLQDHRATRA